MTPRSSSRLTRCCTADTDSPVCRASSVKLTRPSLASRAMILRLVSSTCYRPLPARRYDPPEPPELSRGDDPPEPPELSRGDDPPEPPELSRGDDPPEPPEVPVASDLPITIRWIWLVPSTICNALASRISRSAGKSSTYP